MNTMKTLIDDGLSRIVKLTGIGNQAYHLFLSLEKVTDCKISNYDYLKRLPKYFRRLLYILHSNLLAKRNDYDVIHYQNYYVPFLKGKAKCVVTIHDLVTFKYPETMSSFYVKYNQLTIKKALLNADCIITPSQSIKDEILEMFSNVREKKVFVCEDGIREVFFKTDSKKEILERLNVSPFSYFFFLGSLSPRKNLRFALEAFIEAKEKGDLKKETKLLLSGQFWWGSSDIKHLLREDLGVLALGYVDDEEIVELYKNCNAFIFPSVYEGFGMPLIEAMSQNIPIIISNIPTSIELNNNHNQQMFIFDLGNKEQLIAHLKNIEEAHETIRAKINYGDLSRYNFDNIAQKHLAIYKSLFSDK